MAEKLRTNLDVVEDKNIKNTTLYIKNLKINNESYEAKILSEGNIENLLKYQIAFDGEEKMLKFDVSNTVSLDEYLKNNKLSKNDICKIIIAIDDILMSTENYLISENSLSLDMRLIRVAKTNRGKITYKFVAIPNYDSSFSYELSKFLIRLLRNVDVNDKDALSLGYSLFVRSSKDNYTINDLMELVDLVREKSDDEMSKYSIEDLAEYDERIADEISLDIINENKVPIDCEEYNYSSKTNYDEDENELTIDADTKDILGESILSDFDTEDKKIVKFDKKSLKSKKNKMLSGHIRPSMIACLLAPVLLIAAPIVYFFLIG